jgi:hypothetical protein
MLIYFISLSFTLSHALAEPKCLDNISAINDWLKANIEGGLIETTADDGKPMNIRISEREKQLHLTFEKTKEGIWAEGLTTVCFDKKEKQLEASLSKKNISLGKAAPWLVRLSLSGGATFGLSPQNDGAVLISTVGWKGRFVPAAKAKPMD